MLDKEYYPTPYEILKALDTECVLVGSASQKPIEDCKDIDFVISDKGLSILRRWDRWLSWDSDRWAVYIPYSDDYIAKGEKCLEFFCGLCDIVDSSKWANRVTYDDVCLLPLEIKVVAGLEVFSLPFVKGNG